MYPSAFKGGPIKAKAFVQERIESSRASMKPTVVFPINKVLFGYVTRPTYIKVVPTPQRSKSDKR
jgi:hypothetical protein